MYESIWSLHTVWGKEASHAGVRIMEENQGRVCDAVIPFPERLQTYFSFRIFDKNRFVLSSWGLKKN